MLTPGGYTPPLTYFKKDLSTSALPSVSGWLRVEWVT
nr:MAG TPA: hypothetical protein [Caudoviricetes sp.]